MEQVLRTAIEGGVATLTLARPAARNALNDALLAALAQALTAAAADPAVRCALILGQGGHFAAGADLAGIAAKTAAQAAADPRIAHWAAIRAFAKPLVAGVQGYCLGGGLELATMADLMVVDPAAQLGQPETSLGLVPGAGGGQRLIALAGRARAMRLVLTGELIDGETAFAWGIASHLAAPGGAMAQAQTLAAALADRAPLALRAAKAALAAGAEAGLAFAAERAAFEALLDTADKAEGIAALRDRRPPRFTGA